MKLKSITNSTRLDKRLKAIFEVDDKTITVHFGAKNGSTFIDHNNENKRQAYIARHSKNNEDWSSPTTAGALARYILWEKTSLEKAIKAFKDRFNL